MKVLISINDQNMNMIFVVLVSLSTIMSFEYFYDLSMSEYARNSVDGTEFSTYEIISWTVIYEMPTTISSNIFCVFRTVYLCKLIRQCVKRFCVLLKIFVLHLWHLWCYVNLTFYMFLIIYGSSISILTMVASLLKYLLLSGMLLKFL